MSERIESLDVTKGFLLIMVLIAHRAGFLYAGDALRSCYMAAFFVIAGITQKPCHGAYRQQVVRRAKKLLVPYTKWFSIIIALCTVEALSKGQFSISWLFFRIFGAAYSRYGLYLYGAPENYYFLSSAGAMWFITALFSSYMFFYAALYLIDGRPGWPRTLETVLALLCGAVLLNHLPVLLPWSLDMAPLGAFYMLAGFGLRRVLTNWELRRADRLLLVVCVIALYGMLVCRNPGVNLSVRLYGPFDGVSVFLCAVSGVLGTLLYIEAGCCLSHIGLVKRFLIQVSRSAFPIMALQFWLFPKMDAAFPALTVSNYYGQYGYSLLKAGGVLLICMAIQAADDGLRHLLRRCRERQRVEME